MFFLHHTNLDRLWSKWQASTAGGRSAYAGPKYDAAEAPAVALEDMLNVGGLLPSISVAAVMDTTDGIFCYEY